MRWITVCLVGLFLGQLLISPAAADAQSASPSYYRFGADYSFPDPIAFLEQLAGGRRAVDDYLRQRLSDDLRRRLSAYQRESGGEKALIAEVVPALNQLFALPLDQFYCDAGFDQIKPLRELTLHWLRPCKFHLTADCEAALNSGNLDLLKLLFARADHDLSSSARITTTGKRQWQIHDPIREVVYVIDARDEIKVAWSNGNSKRILAIAGKYRHQLDQQNLSVDLRAELHLPDRSLPVLQVLTPGSQWQITSGKIKAQASYKPLAVAVDLVRSNNKIAGNIKGDTYRHKRTIRMLLEDAYPSLSRLDRQEFQIARNNHLFRNQTPPRRIAEHPEYEPAQFSRSLQQQDLQDLAIDVSNFKAYSVSGQLEAIFKRLQLTSRLVDEAKDQMDLNVTDEGCRKLWQEREKKLDELLGQMYEEIDKCRELQKKYWRVKITIDYTICDYDFWTRNDIESDHYTFDKLVRLDEDLPLVWKKSLDETTLQLSQKSRLLFNKQQVVKLGGDLELLVNNNQVATTNFQETLDTGQKSGEIECRDQAYWGKIAFRVEIHERDD